MSHNQINSITEVSRRKIMDYMLVSCIHWSGNLDDCEFMGRLYNLKDLPSYDYRFSTAYSDIYQHTVMNTDWPPSWPFTDSRFNLLYAQDEDFLRFICETIHPVVRSNADEIQQLLVLYNKHLSVDGWEIFEASKISGRPLFEARRLLEAGATAIEAARQIAEQLDADYVHRQIKRMNESLKTDDPELAIGTAKEFLETLCKTILRNLGHKAVHIDDFPALVRQATKQLAIVPSGLENCEQTRKSITVLINNLASIGHHLAELRNPYGTGHGKDAGHVGLEMHHARLAVGIATALGGFLFDCVGTQLNGKKSAPAASSNDAEAIPG